ncbi:hypothetical protein [Companilactobacillus nodensis]|nr:hypothetical protein [Companilactobacillus nodensis]
MFKWINYIIVFIIAAAGVIWFRMLYSDNSSLDIFSLGILFFVATYLVIRYNKKTNYKKNYDRLKSRVKK